MYRSPTIGNRHRTSASATLVACLAVLAPCMPGGAISPTAAQETGGVRVSPAKPADTPATAKPTAVTPKSVASENKDDLKYDRAASEAMEKYFEDSFRESQRKGRILDHQKMLRRAAIKSTSVEEFHAAWQTDLQVVDRPAGELLAARFAELGLSFEAEAEAAKRLEQRISITRRGCSRLSAIEEICTSIGVYPDYSVIDQGDGSPLLGAMVLLFCPPGQKTKESKIPNEEKQHVVHLRVGLRPLPMVFAGPMAAEISQLDEHASYAAGLLAVRIHAAGLPASVAAYGEIQGNMQVKFDKIVDQQGQEIAGSGDVYRPWFELPNIQSQTHWWELKNLLRRVEAVHIRGRICLPIPVQVETLRMAELTPGTVASAGGCRLTLGEITAEESSGGTEEGKSEQRYTINFTLNGSQGSFSNKVEQFAIFDAQGRGLKGDGHSMIGDGYNSATQRFDIIRGSFTVSGKPASLVMKEFVQLQTLEYPFELVVPLKSWGQQPLEPVELQFSGLTPISLEVLQLLRDEEFSHVKVRLTNHSNKDVRSVSYTLNFLDDAGKKLNDSPGHFSGGYSSAGAPTPAVAKGNVLEQEAPAFFMPKNTARVTVSMGSVKFMDASVWDPKAPKQTSGPAPRGHDSLEPTVRLAGGPPIQPGIGPSLDRPMNAEVRPRTLRSRRPIRLGRQ